MSEQRKIEHLTTKQILNKSDSNLAEVREIFINTSFECERLHVDLVPENTFVGCNFPKLYRLSIQKPKDNSFVRCLFPRLIEFDVKERTSGSFVSCFFRYDVKDQEIHRSLLLTNCRYRREFNEIILNGQVVDIEVKNPLNLHLLIPSHGLRVQKMVREFGR